MKRQYHGIIDENGRIVQGLVRDPRTKAVLNTNKRELDSYRAERAEKTKLSKIALDYDALRSDVDWIKSALIRLLEK